MDRPSTPATAEPPERTAERTDDAVNDELAPMGMEPTELSREPSSRGAVDHDSIARRAYRRYEERGREEGHVLAAAADSCGLGWQREARRRMGDGKEIPKFRKGLLAYLIGKQNIRKETCANFGSVCKSALPYLAISKSRLSTHHEHEVIKGSKINFGVSI